MAPTPLALTTFAFADGNSPGHVCALGSAPSVGDYDLLGVNSDTTVSTPSGFTLATSRVNAQGSYTFYRKAVGGESSSVTIVTAGNFNTEVIHERWSGLDLFDVAASSSVVGTNSNTSNPVTSGTLATATDFVWTFVALASIGTTANQSAPAWSSGYTARGGPNPQGTGSSGVSGLTAYAYPVGTAAENPSVTWTGDAVLNRDSHLIALTTLAAGGTAVLASTLGQLTSALTATQTDRAVVAGTLGQLTSTLTGTQTDRAVVAAGLGQLTSALTGTAVGAGSATLASTLGQLTSALTVAQTDRATLAATLGQLASALTAQGPAGATTPGQVLSLTAGPTGPGWSSVAAGGPGAGLAVQSGPTGIR